MLNKYTGIKKCPQCSGPIFKYINISHNTFIVKCGHTKHILSDNGCKEMVFTDAKKLPCEFYEEFSDLVYYEDKNDIDEIYYSRENNSNIYQAFPNNFNEDLNDGCDVEDDSSSEEGGYDLEHGEDDENESGEESDMGSEDEDDNLCID